MISLDNSQEDYKDKTCDELKKLCKERNIKGYSGMKKEDIIKLLEQNNNSVNKKFSNHIKNPLINIFNDIIESNKYIQNCKSNKKKDINSLSYLINQDLSQSDCIKLGICLENILSDLICNYTSYKNIKEKNKKGDKEKDLIFIDEDNKKIFYAEIKSNINLDTEKSKATEEKCINIKDELINKYPEYEIIMRLVATRYYTKSIIPSNIYNKYSKINKNNLDGINEFLNTLNIQYKFNNEKEYANVLNIIAKCAFK